MPNPNIEGKASKDRKCPILGGGEISSAYNNSNNLLSEITPATISFIVCLYNSNEESEHFTSTSDGSWIFFVYCT